MKIQCEECGKEASVFCTADEAALCPTCDVRVHNANKLAAKHHRFTLGGNRRDSKEFPLCDVCQGKRALVFCKEDRALVCKECDLPMHRANQHTTKHSRFLLSRGLEISAADSESHKLSTNIDTDLRLDLISNPSESMPSVSGQQASASTSGISEYVMEGVPSWRFEDLLDAPFCHYM